MILGIDIGTSSIGWALLESDDEGSPCGLIDAGVRVFPAGVEGDIESGREEPRNLARRAARSARRLNWREGRRHRRCVSILQAMQLLPPTEDLKPATLDAMFTELDAEIRPTDGDHRSALTWHYGLRARALDEKLDPFEVGRAIVHLLRRRGFRSNRKDQTTDDKETGKVKKGIQDLANAMEEAGHRTVGEHFAALDPEVSRIRTRWLGRDAIVSEFMAIVDAQKAHHPVLQGALMDELRSAAFFQRPLKPVKSGRCSLEPDCHRARMASLVAQRYRMLQGVANLQVLGDGPPRDLRAEEREDLVEALDQRGDLTWPKVRKVLGLPRTVTFNLQEGGEKHLIGNRTGSNIRQAFGARWDEMDDSTREAVVEDLLTFEKANALRRRARGHWGLDPDAADLFASLELEPGYARLSTEAMERLLPDLEAGIHYATARRARYPESFSAETPQSELPPVRDFDRELRNPTVERCLGELRKVVNAIVRRHGRPDRVRIELGRDLKRGRKDRARLHRDNRGRANDRERTRDAIRTEAGIAHPSRADVVKARLAEECNFECPFTGRRFGWVDLFGPNPAVDVEHIVPFSKSLDDSYLNKTLCFHEENRNVKRNRTPFEAYGSTPRWSEILDRVARFSGDAAQAKLRRFQMEELGEDVLEDFSSRQLNDTRYASRLAMDYLGTLYGGRVDASGTVRIQATTGGLTAHLRRGLQLEGILSNDDAPFKNRSDHRHHAVDAVAIALVDQGMVQRMARRADDLWRRGEIRALTPVQEPWVGFMEEVRNGIESIVVSHRGQGGLRGQLHEETNYSKERTSGRGMRRTVRKPLASLTPREVGQIADVALRGLVQRTLESRGLPPAKAFAEGAPPLVVTGKDGRSRTVRRVRVLKPGGVSEIGRGPSRRWVKPGSNHHMAIHAVETEKGTTWESTVVTLLEANERRRLGKPVIDRGDDPGRRFVCSLRSGDSVVLILDGEGEVVCTVNTVSGSQIEVTRHADARTSSEIRKAGKDGGRLKLGMRALCDALRSKVDVLPDGHVRTRRD